MHVFAGNLKYLIVTAKATKNGHVQMVQIFNTDRWTDMEM